MSANVTVVGAGISGLTCAVRLQEQGHAVTVVTADEPAGTVSRLAAAVWYPTRTAADPRVLGWAHRTYDELMAQAAAGVPGVVPRPTRMILRGTHATPWWAAAVPDFAAGPDEWRFTVPSVEMEVYLPWLLDRFETAGGRLVRHRLARLADAPLVAGGADVVVNASGLAARDLAGDPAVHPARGQVVGVANPGLVTSVRDEDHPAGMTYVHPRSRDVVLGGTFQPGDWDTTVDPATTAAILARCVELVPELAGAPVVWQAVGLRPARHGGARVELDPVALPGGARVVHDYGHGGAGITLAWGCAEEVGTLTGGAAGA
ncbi:FAD-dependent oxidoreductase [Dactylosporangium sp. NPDC049525]|uniref:FAD-dependent oxidoreductase n=1 Tax=Dactylosporangium sp. NPDC049525 TaxID=3154730 RepID=UPI0034389400